MPSRVKATPMATQAQNAVERSSSVISSRWISAAPNARSAKTMTRRGEDQTSAATPKSAGLSSRARMSATISRELWRKPWDRSFQHDAGDDRARRRDGAAAAAAGRRRGVGGGRGGAGGRDVVGPCLHGSAPRSVSGARSITTPSAASRNTSIVTWTKLKASKVSIPNA